MKQKEKMNLLRNREAAGDAATGDNDPSGSDRVPSDPKRLSRLERLKKKIKKLQGKDPDIYPMW